MDNFSNNFTDNASLYFCELEESVMLHLRVSHVSGLLNNSNETIISTA